MSHKTMVRVAIAMIIVFIATIVLFPTIFNPDTDSNMPIEGTPAPEMPPVVPEGQ